MVNGLLILVKPFPKASVTPLDCSNSFYSFYCCFFLPERGIINEPIQSFLVVKFKKRRSQRLHYFKSTKFDSKSFWEKTTPMEASQPYLIDAARENAVRKHIPLAYDNLFQ